MAKQTFPADYFRRYDESDDALFYREPRKVVHIDAEAIAAASRLYGELLPGGGHILDLMSSWRTHLPPSYKPGRVTGLGMNAEEMRDNPQLTDFVVHNLNQNSRIPFADQTFDGAICTVSVQYLTNPVAIFTDLYRVLKPGAVAVFTFSNRCFPTKAIAVWQSASMEEKAQLVASYFKAAGFADIHSEDRSPERRFGLFTMYSDPLFGVWAYKPSVEG
jgi:SAM-dependent methyltransferase